MKKWKLIASVCIAGLAMTLMLMWNVNAWGREWQGDTDSIQDSRKSRDAAATTQVITSAFSYQGMLKEEDTPVNGEWDMVFTLYANPTCTMTVGTPMTHTVPISEGVFSVNLNFDPAAFNGQALWLKTEIEGTTMGCQPIQTVPYANSLRPGAVISGPVNAEETLFHVRSGVENMGDGVVGSKLGHRTGLGYPVGLYAYAYDYGAVGVWGVSDSEFGWGVNGIAEGKNSIGIRGIANALTSTTYGVYGESASPDGYGGYFLNTTTSGDGWALLAEGRHGVVITSTGGSGLVASGSGDSAIGDDGVRGTHTGDGVVGESSGTENLDNGIIGFSEGGYGVYGFSNDADQYGGYFGNPIYVNGGCTGCTMRYVARNTSESPLLVGDVVQAAGVDARLAGAQEPVIQVALAESDDSILGVVVGRTEMTIIEPGTDDVQPGAHYGRVDGPAAPGDYVVIVVQGMAQVRLDPTAMVRTGDRLDAGMEGAIKAINTSSFAMALDEVDSDGLVWALVGFD